MATIETTFHKRIERISPTRQRVMGILFILLGLIIWYFFSRGVEPGVTTSFGLSTGNALIKLPSWIIPTRTALYALAVICAVMGGYQLARGFQRFTNGALGIVVGFFIFGFLVWAAAGKSMNFTGLLASSLDKAVPITLGALSGVLCERAGVVNIAIEGMMLMSAMVAALIASITKSLWIGLFSGIVTGALMAWILGVLSIKYKTNQIISGTVINILATGMTSYISAKFLQVYEDLNSPGLFKPWPIPGLADIPIIGEIFFNNNLFIYGLFIFLIVIQIALFQTKWGLRVRSVGEHPKAADTLGINVIRTRYMSVLLGGMMAGFAGAYFTLGSSGRFDEVMTAGRGFIGLAAMIFGNWTPFGSFGAGLIFGFADSLAARIAILGVNIPSEFLLMAPYAATMIVLAGVIGKGHVPAADGVAYEKE